MIRNFTNLLLKQNNVLKGIQFGLKQQKFISFLKKNQQETKNKFNQSEEEVMLRMRQQQNQNDQNQNQKNNTASDKGKEIQQKAEEKQTTSSQSISDDPIQDMSGTLEQEENPDEANLKEIQLMHNHHKELQKEVDSKFDIPLKLYGWLDIPETKTAYMGERVFAENKLPKHYLLDHLYKIYQGSIYSMADCDKEFLNEYCEKNFAEKTLKNFQQYKDQGYTFQVYEDVSGIKGEPVSLFYYIVDMVLVRGLDVDRDKNSSYKDYHKYVDIEDMGLVIYTPLNITKPENFIDPEKNKTIYDDYKKMVCRILTYIRTPLRMKVIDPSGNEVKIDDTMYTWEHLAVFETQMIEPPKFKSFYKLENYMEWMGKFKFGTWKMVDLDNWFLGNPLIKNDPSRDKYDDEIFKGSKYDRQTKIDIRII